MASSRGFLNIQSLNELTSEKSCDDAACPEPQRAVPAEVRGS